MAVAETERTGEMVFYSRSRNKLWKKGESSGHVLRVKEIRLATADFVKCAGAQYISKKGFLGLADSVETLAETEGLFAHLNCARVRR